MGRQGNWRCGLYQILKTLTKPTNKTENKQNKRTITIIEQNKQQTWKCIYWTAVTVENQNTRIFFEKKKKLLLNRTAQTTITVIKSLKLTVVSEIRKEASWDRQVASGNDKAFSLSLFQATCRLLLPGTNQHCHTLFVSSLIPMCCLYFCYLVS